MIEKLFELRCKLLHKHKWTLHYEPVPWHVSLSMVVYFWVCPECNEAWPLREKKVRRI